MELGGIFLFSIKYSKLGQYRKISKRFLSDSDCWTASKERKAKCFKMKHNEENIELYERFKYEHNELIG